MQSLIVHSMHPVLCCATYQRTLNRTLTTMLVISQKQAALPLAFASSQEDCCTLLTLTPDLCN